MRMDSNIMSSIEAFFEYGLHPGSCTALLLQEEFEAAKLHAHPLLREDLLVWKDHVKFVKLVVPICCKGENFNTWKGYAYLSEEEKLEIKVIARLSCKYTQFVFALMDKHLDGEFIA